MTRFSFVNTVLPGTALQTLSPQRCSRRPTFMTPTAIAIHIRPGTAAPGSPRQPNRTPQSDPLPDDGAAFTVTTTGEFLEAMARAAKHEIPAFVLFHAGYCRACKVVVPKFRNIADETSPRGLFVTVKMEDASALAVRLGIRQIPVLHVYNGEHGKVEEFACGPSSMQRLRDTVLEFCE